MSHESQLAQPPDCATLNDIITTVVGVLQGTFLPANVSEQLDDMCSHSTLVTAATKVKTQYARLRLWRSSLLKESSQNLAGGVAADDIGTEIENVLKR